MGSPESRLSTVGLRSLVDGGVKKLDSCGVAARLDLGRSREVLSVLVHTPERKTEHELT